MKKIAVITGASSGMGRRFAETVDTFDRFDEVWVIARHEKALEELRLQLLLLSLSALSEVWADKQPWQFAMHF